MVSWKLIVEDYGKIKHAEIEAAPLTLFVGDNNSGKSYLLALLWGIEKFGVEALIGGDYVHTDETADLIEWICTQIDIAAEKRCHEVSLDKISDTLDKVLNMGLEKNKSNLVRRIFNSQNIHIGNLSIKFGELKDSTLRMEYDKEPGFFDLSMNGVNILFGFEKDIIALKAHRESYELQWILVQGIYRSLMNIGWGEDKMDSCIYLPAARTGFMLTKDIINKVGRKNAFNLSEEREMLTPFVRPINQFLDVMGDMSSEIVKKKNRLMLASEIEDEMANGTIEISAMPNKEVQYVPDGYEKGIPLRLSSAVVTELSPLILILKHKDDVKRFYYEEPEMCLHPQLQYKMGKIISRTVNSGIGMVITTHSDIIMQHINNMIKLAKREDCKEICEKLGYTELDLLSHDQVKVYQFSADSREKTEVKELACGEDGFSIATFNDALDKIMDESYEIQG